MKTVTSGIGRIGSFFGMKESEQGKDDNAKGGVNKEKMLSKFNSKAKDAENNQQRSNGNAFSEINAQKNPEFSNLIPETEDDYKRLAPKTNKWTPPIYDEPIKRGKKRRETQSPQQNPNIEQRQQNPESDQKQYKKQKLQDEKQSQDDIMEYLNSTDEKKKYEQKYKFDDSLNGQINKETIALQKAYFGLSRAIISSLKIKPTDKKKFNEICKLLCPEKLSVCNHDGAKIHHQSSGVVDAKLDVSSGEMTPEMIDNLVKMMPLEALMQRYSPEKIKTAIQYAKKELPKFDFEKTYSEMIAEFKKAKELRDEKGLDSERKSIMSRKNASLTSILNQYSTPKVPSKCELDYQLMKSSAVASVGAKHISINRLGLTNNEIKSTESIKGRSYKHVMYQSYLTGFKNGQNIPIMNCVTNIDPINTPNRRESIIQTSFRSSPKKLQVNPSGPSCICDLTRCKTTIEIYNTVRTFVAKYSNTGSRFIFVGSRTTTINVALTRCGVSPKTRRSACSITRKPLDDTIRALAQLNEEANSPSQIILHSCTKEKSTQPNPLAVLKAAEELCQIRSSHITKAQKTLKEEIAKASKRTTFSLNPNRNEQNPQIANGSGQGKSSEIEMQDHINSILANEKDEANETYEMEGVSSGGRDFVSRGVKTGGDFGIGGNKNRGSSQNRYQTEYKNQQYSNRAAGVSLKPSTDQATKSANTSSKNNRQNCVGVQGGKSARSKAKSSHNSESISR